MSKKDYIRLQPSSIFDWQAIINYLSREHNEVSYSILDNRRVRRLFKVGDDLYLCDIDYDEAQQAILVRSCNQESFSEQAEAEIAAFVSEWFDLERNLDAFYSLAENDDFLSELIKLFRGLRLVGMPDIYEAITWGILGQQINLSYAYTLKRRFVEKYGQKFTYQGEDYWLFPQPELIAQKDVQELQELKLTQRKAEYLLDISKRICQGQFSKNYYLELSDSRQMEKEMIKIRGIGPWTAHYVMMRCLRCGDAFPMADIGLLNGIKEIAQSEAKPDKELLLELKERWGDWAAYATFYIWRLLY